MPFISFEVDEGLKADIERAVRIVGDTDRSKFIRAALRVQIRQVAAGEKRARGVERTVKEGIASSPQNGSSQ